VWVQKLFGKKTVRVGHVPHAQQLAAEFFKMPDPDKYLKREDVDGMLERYAAGREGLYSKGWLGGEGLF